ncbi:MAG: hypothetical protein E7290_08700 [Lachnospiraceae bacterium]|nr:hypothetical protein [Lachnospiraceae bacterium]
MENLEGRSYEQTNFEFEYLDIDAETLKEIQELNVDKYDRDKLDEWYNREKHKWCVDTKNKLGIIRIQYVSPAIVRCDPGQCCETYLFLYSGGYCIKEFDYIENHPETIKVEYIKLNEQEEKIFHTVENFKSTLIEAMDVLDKGRRLDWKKERELRDKEALEKTPQKIMYGKFSEHLESMVGAVHEIQGMDTIFRKLCLRHFEEYNVAVQGYKRFYLHDDKGAFFIFDTILWMFLHVSDSYSRLQELWKEIINEKYWYENPYGDAFTNHFCIDGDKKFFWDKYIDKRIEEQRIVIEDDLISMSENYAMQIVEYLQSI